MKKLFYIFTLVAFTLTSCNDNEVVQKQSFEEPTPPTFVSKLPSFNAEALYVVGREYETFKDGTSRKSPKFKVKGNVVNANAMTLYEYIEMRLIELYPDVAYVGMAKDMEQEGTQAMQMYNDYLAKRKIWEESQGIFREEIIETPAFTSIEDEIQLMSMTPEEEANFRALNALATGSEFATTSDFENLFKVNSNSCIQKAVQFEPVSTTTIVAVVASVGLVYTAARVLICYDRAINQQKKHYPESYSFSGNPADAFKHIYVSMMLRRYLSQPMSWLIMDVGWENIVSSKNLPLDKYMDYHNNNVGRDTQYDLFRGKWWADMHEWELWGTKVRGFVNDATNNGVKHDWTLETNEDTVKSDRNSTNKNKYIYWNIKTN